jgi:hypothetical protein
MADGPVGSTPRTDFPPGPMPAACHSAPKSATCVNAAVYYLDRARARLGHGPYKLPADFASLGPGRQAFILTNLDRLLYGLKPIPGLTAQLDQDAAAGVRSEDDPHSRDRAFGYYTSNWAGGYANMPLAYEGWMYDDGYGSGNEDCTSPAASGCWGHRHDVLWKFGGSDPLAMGAAAGMGRTGLAGYAMLLGEGDRSYHPTYTYTWREARAEGAGTNRYNPGSPGAR